MLNVLSDLTAYRLVHPLRCKVAKLIKLVGKYIKDYELKNNCLKCMLHMICTKFRVSDT